MNQNELLNKAPVVRIQHIGKGSVGGPESKTVGVATVLQATPHGGPRGAQVPEEHKDA